MNSWDLKSKTNPNYTISVFARGKELIFRDITGKDLELLEELIEEEELTLEKMIEILELINLSDIKISKVPAKLIPGIFEKVGELILCNMITKYKWLEICYSICDGSFAALESLESQPMSKIMAMLQIHNAVVDKLKPENES